MADSRALQIPAANTSLEVVPEPTDFLSLATPDSPASWTCIDDRHPTDDTRSLVFGENEERAAYQIAGGAHGIALDVVLAVEASREGFVRDNFNKLPTLAATIRKIVTKRSEGDIDLLVHEGCAAISVAEDSVRKIDNEDVFRRVSEIHPGMEQEPIEEIAAAAGRLAASRLILPADETMAHFRQEGDQHVSATRLVGKHNTEAGKVAFLADYRKGGQFDTKAAQDAGVGSFHANFGPDLTRIYDWLYPVFGVNPDLCLSVSALRHAALFTHFLKAQDPNGQEQPIPTIRIDEQGKIAA